MVRPVVLLAVLCVMSNCAYAEYQYLVGRAICDITGPPMGLKFMGYNRQDQSGEGIQSRQYARAFAIAERDGKNRVVYVVADLCMPSYTLKLAVLEKVASSLGERYRHENLVLTATHTHGAPGGYYHHNEASPLGGMFCQPYFDTLTEGIAEAVIAADADLQPGNIYMAQGEVEQASVNRSAVAYLNNSADERARYSGDTDKVMTLLKFVREEGPVGVLTWFPVHTTSMNFFYRLITGDNKGFASALFEKAQGTTYSSPKDFVAGFGNSNCGDVTPNLNLNATGPGMDCVESNEIIGRRQYEVARRLFDQATESLTGPVEYRHNFVDFPKLTVAAEFTGAGDKRLCPSAMGYSFAAGSTEDGGGHPLFREGMTKRDGFVENLLRASGAGVEPSEEFRNCQAPKPILLATGLSNPPQHEQTITLGLVKIGSLVLVAGSGEFTTMTGRRICESVAKALEVAPKNVVFAGYANDFAGYVTTYEEYQTQQYEGAHTLFGPWTEAGQRQEFVRLARAIKDNLPVEPTAQPEDMRKRVENSWRDGPDEADPTGAQFGDIVVQPEKSYVVDDLATAVFWTGRPSNGYQRGQRYFTIERLKAAESNQWEPVLRDGQWEATCQWQQMIVETEAERKKRIAAAKATAYTLNAKPVEPRPEPFQVTIQWSIPPDAQTGTYRIVHHGRFKKNGKVEFFDATSSTFEIVK